MTLIVHRCTVCRHPDCYHGDAECSYGHCSYGRHPFAAGPSEYLATYSPVTGAVTTTVTRPGSAYTAFGRGAIATCDCEDCQTLYRSWRGVA